MRFFCFSTVKSAKTAMLIRQRQGDLDDYWARDVHVGKHVSDQLHALTSV